MIQGQAKNTSFADMALGEILGRFESEAVSVLAQRGTFDPLAVLCTDQTLIPLVLDFETQETRDASFGMLQDAINLYRPEFAVLLTFETLPTAEEPGSGKLHLLASIATSTEEVHECFMVEHTPSRLELVKVTGRKDRF
ncbi:MAG: hypothetical protein ACOC24_01025, partial [Desulfovibrionales bacterium]